MELTRKLLEGAKMNMDRMRDKMGRFLRVAIAVSLVNPFPYLSFEISSAAAAEFEVVDKFTVNGPSVFRSSATFSSSTTWTAIGAQPVSQAARGTIYFNAAENKFKVSENAGAYFNLLGGFWNQASGLVSLSTITDRLVIGRSDLTEGMFLVSTNTTAMPSIYVSATSGNVGLGTTSPAVPLHIKGENGIRIDGPTYLSATISETEGRAGIIILKDQGNTRIQLDAAPTAGNYNFFNTGTNFGIGTVTPAQTLDVNGSAQFGSGAAKSTFTATGALSLAGNAALTLSGASGNVVSGASVTASAFFGSGAALTGIPSTASISGTYVAKAGDTMTGQLTNTSTITVQGDAFSVGGSTFVIAGGNVGIGTTAPAAKLDVNGSSQFGSGSSKSTFTAAGDLQMDSSAEIIISSGSAANPGLRFQGHATGLMTNTSGAMDIVAGGTQLVRFSINPATELIMLSGGIQAGDYVRPNAGSVGAPSFSFPTDSNTGMYSPNVDQLGFATAGALRAFVGGSGSIGIGTSVPAALLHVSSAASSGASLLLEVSSGSAAGQEILSVQAGGNVGLGTTNPASRLTVLDGDIRISTTAGSKGIYFQDGSFQATAAGTPGTFVQKTGDSMSGPLTMASGSTVTVSGNAFSVGASTLVVRSGNVGIGNTLPRVKLVVGDFSYAAGDYPGVNAANTLNINNSNATTSTDQGYQLTLTETGAVGANKGGALGFQAVYDGASNVATVAGIKGLRTNAAANDFAGYLSFLTRGYTAAAPVERMRIDSVGRVGVGTTAPAARLHVSSASAIATDVIMKLSTGTGVSQDIVVVKGDGKVGIGASNPAALLDVNGDAQFGLGSSKSAFATTGALTLAGNAALTLSGETGNITTGSSVTASAFFGSGAALTGIPSTASISGSYVAKAGDTMSGNLYTPHVTATTSMTVSGNSFSVGGSTFVVSNGRVGIGTTSLDANFQLRGNSNTYFVIDTPAGSTGAFLLPENGAGRWQLGREAATNDMFLYSYGAAATVLTVDYTTGFLGVGTRDPATRLEVNGDAQFGAGATKSTFTTTGALSLAGNAALTLSGASGNIVTGASVTASAFFGSGAALTGIPSTASISGAYVAKAGDTMTGQLSVLGSSVTIVNATSADVYSLAVTSASNRSVYHLAVSTMGNVGIGTTAPGMGKLEVESFSNGDQSLLRLRVPNVVGNDSQVNFAVDAAGSSLDVARIMTSYDVGGNVGLAFHTFLNPTLSEAMRLTSTGYAGIGTTNPSAKLHISSAASSATTPLMILSSGTAAGQEVLRVQANGSVGVGTASPSTKLEVNGDAQFGAGATKSTFTTLGALTLAGNAALTLSGASGNIVTGASVTASAFFGSGAALTGIPSTASISGTYVAKGGDTMTGNLYTPHVTATTSMTVQGNAFSVGGSTLVVAGGNVGIGTTSPANKLQVENAGAVQVLINNTGGNQSANIQIQNTDRSWKAPLLESAYVGGNLYIYDNTAGRYVMTFHAGTGKVGVGGAHTPAGTFAVQSLAGGSEYALVVSSQDGTTRMFVVQGNGNVGIGTTSPSTKLEVNGDAQFGAGATKSTFTTLGALSLAGNAALTLAGASGNIVTASSVTASAFFGSGAALTGIPSTASISGTYVAKGGDTMTGNLYTPHVTATTSMTVSGSAFSVGGSTLSVASGRVGVGTTNPMGDVHVKNASHARLRVDAGAGAESVINFDRDGAFIGQINTKVNDAMWFYAGANGSAPRLSVSTNVGIGTTDPIATFHVSSAASSATTPILVVSSGVSAGQELLRVQKDGNVGIGTTSPATKLHVSSGTFLIDGDAATSFKIGTSSFVVTSAGYVGISTSAPVYPFTAVAGAGWMGFQNISQDTLHVTGTNATVVADSTNGNSPGFIVKRNNGYIGGLTSGDATAPGVGTIQVEAQNSFRVCVNGGAACALYMDGTTANPTTAIGLQSAGTVSTFTATGALSLAGNAALTLSGASGNIATGSSVTASAFFGSGAALTGIPSTASISGTYVAKGGDTMTGNLYTPHVTATTSMTVQGNAFSVGVSTLVVAGGNVGIGTTSPASKLSINGSARLIGTPTSSVTLGFGTDDGVSGWSIGNGIIDNTHAFRVYDNTAGLARVTLDDIGSLGIGTTGPAATLHVSSAASSASTLLLEISSGAAAGQELLVVQAGGNVGIGTTNPGEKTEIAGNLYLNAAAPNLYMKTTVKAPVLFISGSADLNLGVAGGNGINSIFYNSGGLGAKFMSPSGTQMALITDPGVNVSTHFFVSAGSVGIGTTSPSRPLTISGPGNSGIGINTTGTGSGNTAQIAFGEQSVEKAYLTWWSQYGTMGLTSGAGTDGIHFNPTTGKVGIATVNPATTLEVNGNAQFGSGATKSTFTTTGALTMAGNAALTLSGASGNVVTGASVTASAFFGYGGNLTGLPSSEANTYASSKTFTNGVGITGGDLLVVSTATVRGNAFSVGGSTFVVVGGSVGIGTTAPGALLHVSKSQDNARSEIVVSNPSATGSSAGIRFGVMTDDDSATSLYHQRSDNTFYVDNYGDPGSRIAMLVRQPSAPFSSIEAMRIIETGFVGMGTGSPAATLHVSSVATAATTPLLLVSSGIAAGQELLVVQAGGNVGVGTSNPATHKLHVSAVGSGATAKIESRDNGGTALLDFDSARIYRMQSTSGGLFHVSDETAGAYRLTLDGAGSVGVGTSGPAATLHVSSAASAAGTPILLVSSGTGTAQELLWVQKDGKVGIGTTAPGNKLVLVPGVSEDGLVVRELDNGNDAVKLSANSGRGLLEAFNAGALNVQISGGADNVFFNGGGNLGIGTAAPATKLEVNGTAQFGSGATKSTFTSLGALTLAGNAALTLSGASGNIATASSVTASAFFGSGAALTGIPSTASISGSYVAKAGDTMSGNLYTPHVTATTSMTVAGNAFSVGGSTLVVAGGSVGIGTTNPTEKLHVAGNIQFGNTPTLKAADGAVLIKSNTAGTSSGLSLSPSSPSTGSVVTLWGQDSSLSNGHRLELGEDSGAGYAWLRSQALGTGTQLPIYVQMNGTTAMAFGASGRVGVGVDAPSARLHVSSANASAADSIFQISSGTSVGQELLVVKGDGKVGVGTTNPGYAMEVSGGSINGTNLAISNTDVGGGTWRLISSGSNNSGGAGNLFFYNGTNVGPYIKSTGNVGIGTAGPAGKLHVSSGVVLIDGAGGALKIVDGTQGAGKVLTSDANGLASWSSPGTGDAVLAATQTFNGANVFTSSFTVRSGGREIIFSTSATAGVSSIFVSTLGNVGIGTTSPAVKLDVGGSLIVNNADATISAPSTLPGYTLTGFSVVASAVKPWIVQRLGASGEFSIENAVGTPVMQVQDDGRVGVGTTAAAATLHVSSAASSGTTPLFVLSSGAAAGQELLRVQAQGNLGIGSTNPLAKLHITSGSFYMDGTGAQAQVMRYDAAAYRFGTGTIIGGIGASTWYDNYSVGLYGDTTGDPTTMLFRCIMGGGICALGSYSSHTLSPNFVGNQAGSLLLPGNLGVGIFNPQAQFHVVNATASAYALRVSSNDASGAFFSINSAGSVGISTITPISKFQVHDGDIRISTTFGAVSRGIYFQDGTLQTTAGANGANYVARAGDSMTGPLTMISGATITVSGNAFSVGTSTLVVAGGRVGIGTTVAEAKLHLVGTDGLLIIDNTAGTPQPMVTLRQSASAKWSLQSNVSGTNDFSIFDHSGAGAHRVVIQDATGNLGVGTTAPSATLHVSSAATSATTPLLIVSSGTGTAQELLWVQKDGKVGIGTTNPGTPLQVNGNAGGSQFVLNDGTNDTFILGNDGTGGEGRLQIKYAGSAGVDLNANGNSYFQNGNLGIGTTVPTARLHVSSGALLIDGTSSTAFQVGISSFIINNQGRVGVGTASPDHLLELKSSGTLSQSILQVTDGSSQELFDIGTDAGGDVVVSASVPTGGPFFVAKSAAGGRIGIGTASPAAKLHVSSGTLLVDGDAATAFKIGVSSFVVTSDGNVGIGTAIPGAPFHIKFAADQNLRFGQLTGNAAMYVYNDAASSYNPLKIDGSELYLNSQSGGNVGIGTVSPLAKFEVKQSASNSFAVRVSSNDGAGMLVVNNQGNVGIGTISPGTLLDVAGAIRGSSITLTGTGTDPYNLTTSSGIHILKGKLKLEQGAWIEWADGSTSSSTSSGGGSGNGGGTTISSVTWCTSNTIAVTANVLNATVPGSTITFTAAGNIVKACFSGSMSVANNTSRMKISILKNGNVVAPLTISKGITSLDQTRDNGNMSFCWPVSVTPGVSTNLALVAGSDGTVNVNLPRSDSTDCSVWWIEETTGGSSVAVGSGGWSDTSASVFVTTATKNVVVQSTLTVQGNAFSVGTSTLVVAGGRVGIGLNDPGFPLEIKSGANTGLAIRSDASSADVAYLYAKQNGGIRYGTLDLLNDTAASKTFLTADAGENSYIHGSALVVKGTGGVGVGVTNPSATLHVSSQASAGATPLLIISSGTAAGQEVLRVLAGGNIGMGTTAPTARLHISSGTLVIDGNAAQSLTINNQTTNAQVAGFNCGDTPDCLDLFRSGGGGLQFGTDGNSNTQIKSINRGMHFYQDSFSYATQKNRAFLFDQNGGTGVTVLAVRGIAGQTGDMQEWQNSADVAVASITANGSFVTGASVTASAFFGSGAALTGIPSTASIVGVYAALAATQTFSGANTFDSSFTVRSGGREIVLSTSATAGVTSLVVGANGNVGIGTSAPSYKLDIINGAGSQTRIVGGGVTGTSFGLLTTAGTNSSDFSLHAMDAPGLVSYLKVRGDGNVGVGNSSPSTLFQVGGGTFSVAASGNVGIGTTAPNNGSNTGRVLTLNHGEAGGGYNSVFESLLDSQGSGKTSYTFYDQGASAGNTIAKMEVSGANNKTGNFNFLTSNTAGVLSSSLFIKTGGSVGLSTTTPTSKLHVHDGDIRISTTVGAASKGIYFQDGTLQTTAAGDPSGYATLAGTQTFSGANTFNSSFTVRTGGREIILSTSATSGVASIFVSKTGNVGVGTTVPNSLLDVRGISTENLISATGDSGSGIFLGDDGASSFIKASYWFGGFHPLRLQVGGLDAVYVNTAGNVGVGTTAPSATLHVSSAATAAATPLFIVSSGAAAGQQLLWVQKDGKVGVGTTAPVAPIHIQGNSSAEAIRVYGRNNGGIDEANIGLFNYGGTQHGWISGFSGKLGIHGGGSGAGITVDGSGQIGIGTSAPATKLHLSSGTLTIDGTAPGMTIGVSTFVVAGGRVGVGTSTPAFALHVLDNANVKQLAIDNTGAQYTDMAWNNNGTTQAEIYWDNSNPQFVLKTVGSNPIRFNPGNATAMSVTAAGNVGIGAASPINLLQVQGPNNALGTSSATFVNGFDGAKSTITIATTGLAGPVSERAYIDSSSDGNAKLGFRVNGSEKITIQNSGNVGIGTQVPGGKLHVSSGVVLIDGSGGALKVVDGTQGAGKVLTSDASGLASWSTAAAGDAVLAATQTFSGANTFNSSFTVRSGGRTIILSTSATAGVASVFVGNTGKVGIGTTVPNSLLDVRGAPSENIITATGDSGSGIFLGDDGASSFIKASYWFGGFHPLRLQVGGLDAVYVNTGGNVGIGTTGPAAELHVSSANVSALGTPFLVSSGTAAGQELLVVKGDGKVGVGTTNPGARLDVNGTFQTAGLTTLGDTAHSGGASTDGSRIKVGYYTAGGAPFTTHAFIQTPQNKALQIWNEATATIAAFGADGANKLQTYLAGNVGIATVNPATTLDVSGVSQFGAGAAKSTITATGDWIGASGSSITLSGANGFVSSKSSITASAFFGSGAALTGIPSTASISGTYVAKGGDTMTGTLTMNAATALTTGDRPSVYIATHVMVNGVMGIGTTAPGSSSVTGLTFSYDSILHMAGSARPSPTISGLGVDFRFVDTNGAADTKAADIVYDDQVFKFRGLTDAGGGKNDPTFLINTNTGRVGVGTVSPATKLHLSSGTLTIDGTSPGMTIGVSTFVVSGGNVGIGTTAPSSKLEVDGAITADEQGGYLFSTRGAYIHSPAADTIRLYSGSSQREVNLKATGFFIGEDLSGSPPASHTLATTGGAGTNIAGSNLIVAAGAATGNAAGGALLFQTSSVGASGATLQTMTERIRVDPNGKVGIGTTGPTATLHVSSAATSATTPILVVSSGAAAGQELLWVQKDGKIGVGTTEPAGLLESKGTSGIQMLITNTATGNGANYWLRNTADNASAVIGLANESGLNKALGFYTGGTSAPTAGTERMRISSTGNIGIGTQVPGGKLHVSSGVVVIDGSGGALKIIDGTQGAGKVLTSDANGLASWSSAGTGDAVLAATQTFSGANTFVSSFTVRSGGRQIIFSTSATAGTSSIFVSTEGRVGVGTTNPVLSFQVSQPGPWSEPGSGVMDGSTAWTYLLASEGGDNAIIWDASRDLRFGAETGVGAGFSEKARITNDGNVGFGTTAPAATLHVSSAATAATTPLLLVSSGSAAGQQLLWVQKDGKVGVGTTAPDSLLQVKGSNSTIGQITIVPGPVAGGSSIGFYRNTDKAQATAGDTWEVGQGVGGDRSFGIAGYGINGGAAVFKIGTSGSVGIGTTDPVAKLHMSSGTLLIDGNAATAFKVGISSFIINDQARVGIGTSNPAVNLEVVGLSYNDVIRANYTGQTAGFGVTGVAPGFGAGIYLNGTQQTHFYGGGLSLGSYVATNPPANGLILAGNVGISTAAPTSKLHVHDGDIRISTTVGAVSKGIYFQDGTLQTTAAGAATEGNTYTSSKTFTSNAFSVGGSTLVVRGGNIGIGTTNPTAKLSFGGADAQIGMATSDGSDNAILQIGGGGTVGVTRGSYINLTGNEYGTPTLDLFAGNVAGGDIRMFTGNISERVTIKNSGNVGIGTAAPATLLDVNGDAQFGSGATKSTFSTTGALSFAAGNGVNTQMTVYGAGIGSSVTIRGTGNGFTPLKLHNPAGDEIGMDWVGLNQRINMGFGLSATSTFELRNVAGGGLPYGAIPLFIDYPNNRIKLGGADGENSPDASVEIVGYPDDLFTLIVSSQDASTSHLVVNNLGFVGLSTTTPTSKLHVHDGDIRISTTMSAGSRGIYFQDGTQQITAVVGSNYVARAGDSMTGPLTMASGSTITVGGNAFSVGASTFVVAGGKIGFGTASIIDKFQFHTDTDENLLIRAGGSVFGVGTIGIDTLNDSGAALAPLGIRGDSQSFMVRNNIVPLFLNTLGRVGVGTTVPSARLHVSSAGALSSETIFQVSSGTSAGQELVVVKGDGKVGIGTTSPATKLHVEGVMTSSGTGNGTGGEIDFYDGSVSGMVGVIYTGNDELTIAAQNNRGLRFDDDAATRLFIKDGGNVGIGTTNPGTLLDVGGAMRGSSITLTGTGTDPYNLTTSSGIHILKGKLKLEQGAWIEWADGSTSSTTGVGSGGSGSGAVVSTQTYYTSSDLTNGTFGVCWAGTTITATTDAYPLRISWNIPEARQIGGQEASIGILLDGQYVNYNAGSTVKGVIDYRYAAAEQYYGSAGSFVTATPVSAGSHSLCLTSALPGAGGGLLCNTRGPCWIRFEEVSTGGGGSVGSGGWSDNATTVFVTTATKNVVIQSTLTVQGNAFSVGTSTLVVAGGNVGIGTTAPSKKLAVSGDIRIQSSAETITGPTSATSDASNPGLYLGYDAANNKAFIRSVLWGTAYEPLYFQGNEFRWATGAGAITEKMVLDVNGNVGIGATAPSAMLHISSSATAGATNNLVLVTTGAANVFRVQANGNVYAQGAFYGGGADLAEMYRAEQEVEAGDVVAFTRDGVLTRAGLDTGPAFGVVSSNPGMVLGQNIPDNDRPDYRPVALTGRVPVKATLENGRIRRGDHLTPSSKPGYAMKAKPGDSVVGMALEDFKEVEGTVLCFIKAGVNSTSEIESLRRDNERLSREISELRSLIEGR